MQAVELAIPLNSRIGANAYVSSIEACWSYWSTSSTALIKALEPVHMLGLLKHVGSIVAEN